MSKIQQNASANLSVIKVNAVIIINKIVRNLANYFYNLLVNNKLKKMEQLKLQIQLDKLQTKHYKNNTKKLISNSKTSLFTQATEGLFQHEDKWQLCINKISEINKKQYPAVTKAFEAYLNNYGNIVNLLLYHTKSEKHRSDNVVIQKIHKIIEDNSLLINTKNFIPLCLISTYNYIQTSRGRMFFLQFALGFLKEIEKIETKKVNEVKKIINFTGFSSPRFDLKFKSPNYKSSIKSLNNVLEYSI